MSDLKVGRYQHYKGNFYAVVGNAINSETLEEVVVYRALYESTEFGKNVLWVRSKKDFLGNVTKDGKEIPRFAYICKI